MKHVATALKPDSWPKLHDAIGTPLPEIALAGRSNVGKSTLINLLSNQKNLAKISSTPGKTQCLQFFNYDEELILVDLPGYGYAKVSQSVRAEWSQAIDCYLNDRPSLKLVLLLLDIRRSPSNDDLALSSWAQTHGTPLLPIFTKTDMLSPNICERQRSQALSQLGRQESLSVPQSSRRLWPILRSYLEVK